MTLTNSLSKVNIYSWWNWEYTKTSSAWYKHLQSSANIVLYKWNNKNAFSLKFKNKARCPKSPLLFNILLEVLAMQLDQRKTSKDIQNEEKERCLIHIWYYCIHKIILKKLQIKNTQINELSNIVGHKSQMHFHVSTVFWKMKSKAPNFQNNIRKHKILREV